MPPAPEKTTEQPTAFHSPVAIGARLIRSPDIVTLGFKPNFQDYSLSERAMILDAPKIYYPTAFYADLFNVMGKMTFPSFHTYKFALDKIKQTALFQMFGIPHPFTRVFYGRRQKRSILDYFEFPFIAKKPKGSAKGNHVYRVEDQADLDRYLQAGGPAYIQEYLPIDRDIRVIIIGKKIRLSYWRLSKGDCFKTNLSQGGSICFDPVPEKALSLALSTAISCGWDDIGIDIVKYNHRFCVLEANVKYGTRGFKAAGIDYKEMLAGLVVKNEI